MSHLIDMPIHGLGPSPLSVLIREALDGDVDRLIVLRRAFNQLNPNSDGKIAILDLEASLPPEMLQLAIAAVDTDNVRLIDFQQAFDQLNPKPDGKIFTRDLEASFPTKMLQLAIVAVDTDKDGLIDFSEFVTSLCFTQKASVIGESLKKKFRLFDFNGDGTISIDCIATVLLSLSFQVPITPDEIQLANSRYLDRRFHYEEVAFSVCSRVIALLSHAPGLVNGLQGVNFFALLDFLSAGSFVEPGPSTPTPSPYYPRTFFPLRADRNSKILSSEFRVAPQSTGTTFSSEEQLRQVFEGIDTDKDRLVNLEEFPFCLLRAIPLPSDALWRQNFIFSHGFLASTSNPSTHQNMDHLRSLFQLFDVDRDGMISRLEFRDALQSTGTSFASEEQLRLVFEGIDTNKDGLIDLEEFASYCSGRSSIVLDAEYGGNTKVGVWSWCKGATRGVLGRLTDARDGDQDLLDALEKGHLTHREVDYIKFFGSTVRSSNAFDAGKAAQFAAAIVQIWLANTASLSGADEALLVSSLSSLAVGYLVLPPASGGRRGNRGVVSRGRAVLSSALNRYGIIAAFCLSLPDHIQVWVLLAACCVLLASRLIG